MAARDPKPEILRLEELALLVRGGDIKLPRFQRPFVWNRTDMLKLLDSIYRGYPIGSLLLWNSSQRLTSERDIAGFQVGEEGRDRFPVDYLLDGQQRLTTLCGSLFWQGSNANSIWNIHFDLQNEVFLYPKDADVISLFPLNKLIGTSDFIRQCMKFDHHLNGALYLGRAEQLLRALKDYKVAVVKLGDMSLEEVAPIFERINSTGRKLTMVDLMMAATWSDAFDLAAEIRQIQASCDGAGFSGVSDQSVLRSIAAAANLGVNKEDIQRLRSLPPQKLREAAGEARDAMIAAVSHLRSELGILDAGFLPYGLQLTYLAEIYRIRKEIPAEMRKKINQWFWFTSATVYFGGASTGQISKDLAVVRGFARGEVAGLVEAGNADLTRLLFDRFLLRNASSTTFALLLNIQKPSKNLAGQPIDASHFGVKSGKLYSSYSPTALSHLNLAKVFDPYQSSTPAHPSPEQFPEHLVTPKIVDAVIRNDVAAFIGARAALISERLEHLAGCTATYRVPGALDSGEQEDDAGDVDD